MRSAQRVNSRSDAKGLAILVVVSLLVPLLASPALAQITIPASAQKSPGVVRSPLILYVQKNVNSGKLSARQKLKLSDVVPQQLELELTSSIKRLEPLRLLQDSGVVGALFNPKSQEITVSTDDQATIHVPPLRSRLTKASEVEIAIEVKRPQDLHPGVYRGEIVAEFSSGKGQISQPFLVKWPVILMVQGRAVSRLGFENSVMRAGSSASMVVEFETVGCPLGEGKLVLESWKAKEPREVALQVLLNQTNFQRGPFNPEVEFLKEKSQSIGTDWLGSVLNVSRAPPRSVPFPSLATGDVSSSAKSAANLAGAETAGLPTVERHVMNVQFGECPAPGFLQIHLDWEQDPKAAGVAMPAIKVSSPEIKVGSGIWASTRYAYEGEVVELAVFAEGDLPDTLQLLAAGPSQQMLPITFARDETARLEGLPNYKKYTGSILLEEPGRWTIGWSRNDSNLDDQQLAALKIIAEQIQDPETIDVCFQYASDLDAPLEVFASHEPIWWPLYFGSYKATGWVHTRAEAIQFAADPKYLKSGVVKKLGWFEVLDQGRDVPYVADENSGPLLSTQFSTDPHDPGESGVVPPKGMLPIGMTVSLLPDDEPHPERHKLGQRFYLLQLMLSGENASKQPIHRIVNVRFSVVVSHSWTYDLRVYLVLAAVLLMGGIWFWLRRRRRNVKTSDKARGSKQKGRTGSKQTSSDPHSERTSSPGSSSGSTTGKKPDPKQKTPEPEKETGGDDDAAYSSR